MNKPKLLEAEEVATIMRFYDVETNDELIAALCHHIERLQAKMQDQYPLRNRNPGWDGISPRIG